MLQTSTPATSTTPAVSPARSWAMLALFLAVVFGAAAAGAAFPPGSWYQEIAKPSWTPPNWLFGPVWTVLYLMIAVSGWQLWQVGPPARKGLGLWGAQLVGNALWSWLFFGLHWTGVALLDLIAVVVLVAATIASAWPVRRSAALLLLPYLAWVVFAGCLNGAIWWLN